MGQLSEIEKALASLSAEDKELVMMMEDCPVSGEPLGSMGTPIKVTKDGALAVYLLRALPGAGGEELRRLHREDRREEGGGAGGGTG